MSKVYLAAILIVFIDIVVAVYHAAGTIHSLDYIAGVHILAMIAGLLIAVSAVLRERKKATVAKIQAAEADKVISTLLNYSPCAIAAISPTFDIITSNKAAFELTGTDDAIFGSKCYDIFGDGAICPDCPVERAVTTRAVQKKFKQEMTRNNAEIYIEQTAVPVLGKDGTVKYVLEMILDITQKVCHEHERQQLFVETVTSLAKLIESRDNSTGTHSARVRDVALAVGRQMELDDDLLEELDIAAILHDIGKIGIPENILNKSGRLTAEEYDVIKKHPEIGYNTLKNIAPLSKIAEYIYHHHESYDGSGYPRGKQGEEIPLVSRILSVADVYEAVSSDRVYRKAMAPEEVMVLLRESRGTKFDPQVVDALFAWVESADSLPGTLCD